MPQFLEHSMTAWKGQRIEHKPSLVDSFDPRARILMAVIFALLVVFSKNLLLPFIGLIIAFVFACLASLHLKRTFRRVIAMDLFVAMMIIMLPFTVTGDELFNVFGLSASKEGFMLAIAIALKANAVVLTMLALVGTMEASTLGHALGRLKVPEKLVHLLLFTVRYLDVISREYRRMRKAMRARAFVPKTNVHTLRSIGYLVGMLLVRSLERSERIYDAMKCRGYCGKLYLFDTMAWQQRDTGLIILAVLFAIFSIASGAYTV
ncbi:cobalt ECF transporter T component CbiQ [Leucothrix arctica]|uniref:Cobalt ECF transporter T component CbiQ n=1 Tax=Leucothrix arctica TaxID=1481894 RepID=A0A317CBL9_9GAMM|nr:cobalt ECF transporter T component CbiQ [Leucothrix arctica]PWQ95521.1 cobalt ECF transporter T component CbiQ [Leucothrix arctica]